MRHHHRNKLPAVSAATAPTPEAEGSDDQDHMPNETAPVDLIQKTVDHSLMHVASVLGHESVIEAQLQRGAQGGVARGGGADEHP